VESIDQVQLNFDPSSLFVLKIVLGLVMFGLALDLRVQDFKNVAQDPKAPAIGLVAQFLLLPALTFLLVYVVDPAASIGLGMILVAACPGGNVSNFITYLAGGRTALSISMTAVSTVASVVMTPLNIAFWGSLNPKTAAILHQVNLDTVDLLTTVGIILGLPLLLGMLMEARLPRVAARLRRPMKYFSIIIFVGFVAVALGNNWQNFLDYVGLVMLVVAVQNAAAFLLGYGSARAFSMPSADRRAIAIEVGIQNSGLGLALIFTFFGGLGGMALVAAWWGVWHIIAGLGVAGMLNLLDRGVLGSRAVVREDPAGSREGYTP